ncbi:LOW QUALITY PROTEIN: hypothetical protein U9M48_033291 [Paspalum notatum var. saurae]|uniref:GDSL esterase/lipase n=1 Tax=Paspalum notatum var. saurae TaxID=547442 RepID=A0AAQ3U993_PASNO
MPLANCMPSQTNRATRPWAWVWLSSSRTLRRSIRAAPLWSSVAVLIEVASEQEHKERFQEPTELAPDSTAPEYATEPASSGEELYVPDVLMQRRRAYDWCAMYGHQNIYMQGPLAKTGNPARAGWFKVQKLHVCACIVVLLALTGPRAAVAAIFSFGDSAVGHGQPLGGWHPGLPRYGMTYFGYPTGRELGLPLLPPSKAKNATFHRGANFAITGATALDLSFLKERGHEAPYLQLPQACRDLFRRSLFIVGEIGGNDYGSTLFAFRPVSEVHAPTHVVAAIGRGVEALIAEGAVELVVPGTICPSAASRSTCPRSATIRRTGCVKDLNTLSWAQRSLGSGTSTPASASSTPTTTPPPSSSSSTPTKYGMVKQTPRACCGAPGVGEHNFNLTSLCGQPGAYACDDPSNHWSWDGIHLTHTAYGHIAKGWLYGPFADPPILDTTKNLG